MPNWTSRRRPTSRKAEALVWLVILFGFVLLLIALAGLFRHRSSAPTAPPAPRRRQPHRAGPEVMSAEDPPITPDHPAFGLQGSTAMISIDDTHADDFAPGGGSGGGAGASGSWEDGGDGGSD